MKKHSIRWALIIPALAFTFACTQKELESPDSFSLKDGVYAVVENPVEIDDAPSTKAFNSDMQFYFTGDERLDVFSETPGEKMTYKIKSVGQDQASCTFLVNSFGLLDATYSALLPAQGLYDDASAVPVSLLGQAQKGNASTEHLAAFDFNVATAEIKNNNGVFKFNHLVSWIRCNVNFIEACTVKSVTLSADGTPFVVKADINVPQKTISPKENASSITLSYEDGIEVAAGEKLTSYFTIFNADFVNLTVVVDAECNGEPVTYTMDTRDLPAASAEPKSIFTREVTAVPDGVVAMIGSTTYATLDGALDGVPADGTQTTIVLLDDVTLEGNAGVTVAAGKNVVLDLNGKTLSNLVNENKASQVIANKGTLTVTNGIIKNGVAEGTSAGEWWGTTQYNYATNVITNTGILVIDGAEIYETAAGSICYAIDNNSSAADAICTVESGYVHKDSGTAIRMFCNSTAKRNDVTVNGGTIDGGYSAIWVQLPGSSQQEKLASLTVKGGELKGSYAFYDYSYGDLFDNVNYNLNGGTFVGDVFSYGANITISGGTFAGDVAIKQSKPSNVSVTGGKFGADVYCYGDNASTGFITGGLFSIMTYEYEGETYDCDWCSSLADGLACVENTDSATSAEYPWTVGESTVVAKIGKVDYATLAEAVAAAESGDEIVLCKNVENIGKTKVPAGVTLNGNGHAVSGDSSIDIDAKGGTVTNVKFENIHNAGNKLSAVYASNLTGNASVIGCTFDNCDWDAIQMEPVAGANITIENNAFSDNAEDGVQQQRFIHVQSAKNVDFTATITENVMIGNTSQGALECYYFTDDAKINISKNYIEDMADVCVLKAAGTFASDMVFPAYVDAEKSATYSPAAMIQTSAYSALFFDTLAEAAAAVTASSNTVKLLADCQNTSKVTFKNDVVIEGNGKTITGSPIAFEGGSTTVKNVVFKNGKTDNESAAYFTSSNVKNVTIDGCTFNDAKWDAMQITSNSLQSVTITGNTFSNQSTGKRYIHIQPSVVLSDAKLTITGNTFNNVTKDFVDDSAVTIYKLMLANMTIENNTTTGAGAGVLTTDEFWINNGDTSDLMSQADVCKAFGGESSADYTVNTQTAFVTAVAEAKSGAVIALAAGEYNLNEISDKDGRDLTFIGAGVGETTLSYGHKETAGASDGGGVACYSFDGSGKITIKNVTFVDPDSKNDYNCGFVRAHGMVFEDCEFTNTAGCYGDQEVVFRNCLFSGKNSTNYNTITYSNTEVTFDGCTFNAQKGAIQLYRTADRSTPYKVTVKDCSFKKNSITTKTPVYFYDNEDNGGIWTISIEGNNVNIDNSFDTNENSGTWIWGSISGTSNKTTVFINGTKVR